MADLPEFVQPVDGVLQSSLLLLREDVSQFITGLQEHTEHSMVQLLEKILQ